MKRKQLPAVLLILVLLLSACSATAVSEAEPETDSAPEAPEAAEPAAGFTDIPEGGVLRRGGQLVPGAGNPDGNHL